MDGPYRASKLDDLPVRKGELLADFDLRAGPRDPFSAFDDVHVTATFEPAGYAVVCKTRDGMGYPMWRYELHDVALQATVTAPATGASDVRLTVRRFDVESKRCCYTATFQPNLGTARLYLRVAGAWSALGPPQPAPSLRRGESNVLEVRVAGTAFLLLANDEPVLSVQDRSLGRGVPSIELGPEGAGDRFVVHGVRVFGVS
ncbi:MAG: hypothetical protein H6719_09990 [Sandaracinaceae bacterium]|nr:hypothetical protein [Sandaracinaceae bacterium]